MTSREAAGPVSRLLCLFGYHVPDHDVVWHHGYGFAHCRRCKQAIVRSLLSGWTIPGPGLRIVWPEPATAKRSKPAATADGLAAPVAPAALPPPPLPAHDPLKKAEDTIAREEVVPGGDRPRAEALSADQPQEAPSSLAEKPSMADEPVTNENPEAEGDALGKAAAEPEVGPQSAPPLAIAPDPDPEPVDLLGPNFMGDLDAPKPPRRGLQVFEFDDMGHEDDSFAAGADLTAQRAR